MDKEKQCHKRHTVNLVKAGNDVNEEAEEGLDDAALTYEEGEITREDKEKFLVRSLDLRRL